MSNNFNHRIEDEGFTEKYKELDTGANQNDQQCSWNDSESDATSPGNAQQQSARTESCKDEGEEIKKYIGPSYADRVERFLEKVFGGISSNTNNISDRDL